MLCLSPGYGVYSSVSVPGNDSLTSRFSSNSFSHLHSTTSVHNITRNWDIRQTGLLLALRIASCVVVIGLWTVMRCAHAMYIPCQVALLKQ
jgi:hypothetical protein